MSCSSARSCGVGSRPSSSRRDVRKALVDRECVGLPAAPVQRHHEQGVQLLVQRMVLHQDLQLAARLRVQPAVELERDVLLEGGEAEALEPGDLGLGERLVAEVE